MVKPFFGAVVMAVLIPLGVAGQDHDHGARPLDADAMPSTDMRGMQEMMQGMQERMQGMHEMMQQMHGRHGNGAPSMGGGVMGAQGPTCVMSGPEGVLSALLYSSLPDLGLSEAQRTELASILARAQIEARATLTDDQRTRLEAAPQQAAVCSSGHSGHGTGAG